VAAAVVPRPDSCRSKVGFGSAHPLSADLLDSAVRTSTSPLDRRKTVELSLGNSSGMGTFLHFSPFWPLINLMQHDGDDVGPWSNRHVVPTSQACRPTRDRRRRQAETQVDATFADVDARPVVGLPPLCPPQVPATRRDQTPGDARAGPARFLVGALAAHSSPLHQRPDQHHPGLDRGRGALRRRGGAGIGAFHGSRRSSSRRPKTPSPLWTR
jgi:hypothetical protein